MDSEFARTFLAVAELGSFAGAADRLHVTQSTVSARIRTLELQMRRKLFERRPHGVTLTFAGGQFLRHAIAIVRSVEQARHDVGVPAGCRAVLAIGAQAGLWNRVLHRWLPWMRGHAKDIAVRAETGSPDELCHRLVQGGLDLAVLYTPFAMPGLQVETVMEERLVLVTSDPADATGLAEERYVHVEWSDDFAGRFRAAFPDVTSPAMVVDIGTMAFDYVLSHGGSGYFPESLVCPHLWSGRLCIIPEAPAFPLTVHAMSRAGVDNDAVGLALQGMRELAADFTRAVAQACSR